MLDESRDAENHVSGGTVLLDCTIDLRYRELLDGLLFKRRSDDVTLSASLRLCGSEMDDFGMNFLGNRTVSAKNGGTKGIRQTLWE